MKQLNKFLFFVLPLLLSLGANGQSVVEFIENQGQWGDWFLYKAETRGGDMLLEKDGFRYIVADGSNHKRVDSFHHGLSKDNPTLKFHCYKVTFVGGKTPVIEGQKPQKTYNNYYLGNDPARWKVGIHPYHALNYLSVYPGIDMHLFSQSGNVEYEFIVKPDVKPDQIQLRFDGLDDVYLEDGNLTLKTSVGLVKEVKPYVYQYIGDERKEVPCNYSLANNVVSFVFPKGYDKSQNLIIDPTVVFSTLTGSTADNWGFSATYDDSGNFYAGGLVNTLAYGGSFPVSTGAFQTSFAGGSTVSTGGLLVAYAADISIIKYNSAGNARLYGTYVGGAGNDHVHSMIVDRNGDLVFAGRTISTDYPVTSGAYQSSNRGRWDMMVSKLNSTGTAMVASTYIGGTSDDCVNYDSTNYFYGELKYNYGDESRSEVLVDYSNNVYVAACTFSSDFPTTSTAISTTLSGAQDAVAFKLNSGLTSLVWSSYIGGRAYDAGYVLAFDSAQTSFYVAGGTNSSDFPVISGAWQSSFGGGGADGFICKFQNGGSYALQRSTYAGTSNYDQIYGIQQSRFDNVYVTGQSLRGAFPVSSGVYSNARSSQFVMKMDKNLSSNLLSTVFGAGYSTKSNISPCAFLVDTCENVFVAGWGGNLGLDSAGPSTGLPVTSDAFQSTTDGSDFYFIVFAPGMTALRYGTFFGANCTNPGYGEHVDGGTSRFDKHGIIYQGICASCGGATRPGCSGPYPTTIGSWSEVDGSPNCNMGALKIAFDLGPVVTNVSAAPTTSGCAPLTVNFTNLTTNGASFLWDFGDGSPTVTTFNASHTFTRGGVFRVRLYASNSNACFVTNDTFELTITVDTANIYAGFTATITDSCGPYRISLANLTTGVSGSGTYLWDFGDGTTYTGATPPPHTYADTGIYVIKLRVTDPAACNSPDSATVTVSMLSFNVAGAFTAPDSICMGTPVAPEVTRNNAVNYLWSFGDGNSSTLVTPTFLYTAPGLYTVRFIVLNPGSCNLADTMTRQIRVWPVPNADFTFVPITPEMNTPITYTNLSTGATRYSWAFGDGRGSVEVNPVHLFNKTGTYNTCLTAYNEYNCPDIACKEVSAEIVPIIGLPSGFSPNGDGENDILFVKGAAIATLNLRIYNRWGQVVFETTKQSVGWDGTFEGQPQPMEAYGYVLQVTFIDGTSKVLKGNITLIR
jgi:gliding motility-associated-like protein